MMMTVDPSEPSAEYKRSQIAALINLTEEQKTIIDLYLLEEKTGMRHWQLDPEDPNVYMEWMNGTNLLRNKVTARVNMTKAQKIAMNNNSKGQKGNSIVNGNSYKTPPGVQEHPSLRQGPPQSQQQPARVPPPAERIIRTSSGKEIPASERPDLARAIQSHLNQPKHKAPKRYRRASR